MGPFGTRGTFVAGPVDVDRLAGFDWSGDRSRIIPCRRAGDIPTSVLHKQKTDDNHDRYLHAAHHVLVINEPGIQWNASNRRLLVLGRIPVLRKWRLSYQAAKNEERAYLGPNVIGSSNNYLIDNTMSKHHGRGRKKSDCSRRTHS